MKTRVTFTENTPSWTKLGTAELFRILSMPNGKEKELADKAKEFEIEFNANPYWIEGKNEDDINDFMEFCAQWCTDNRLSLNINFDLLLENDGHGGLRISDTPIPRPSTLKHVPSNVSNIKPVGVKDVKKDELTPEIMARVKEMSEAGTDEVSKERLKNFKIYKEKRYFEFKVITRRGKQGVCFSCGEEDFLTETKETQYPLTVGISNYGNFYSYHSGKIGFCRACSLANHFALGRVFYYVNDDAVFLGIPEANSISGLLDVLLIIEGAYESSDLQRRISDYKLASQLLIDRSSVYKSNFVGKSHNFSGFYFMVLVLFSALGNSIDVLSQRIKTSKKVNEDEKSPLLKLLGETASKGSITQNLESAVFNSWSFMLQKGEMNVRHWRYQSSIDIMERIDAMKNKCEVKDPVGTISKLVYKSGNNWISQRREDFSRSLLLGKPAIETLERSCWDKMLNGDRIDYGFRAIAECISKDSLGGEKMEKDDVLKQCRGLGLSIAEVTKREGKKSLLYDLRSVGNAQSLRAYLERFTFTCSVMGIKTSINTDFVEKLFEGSDWKKYKSIIAIVANQHYSYITSKEKEVAAE